MKRLNKTHIFHIFFGLLMFLPFISILSRVIYVQSNKNAKDSYSGYDINDVTYEPYTINNMPIGSYVYYTSNNQQTIVRQGTDLVINATNIKLNDITYENADNVTVYAYGNDTQLWFSVREGTTTLVSRNAIDTNISLYFNYVSYNTGVSNNYLNGITFYQINYNNFGSLDNVFDYSISKFIEDNNFKINFFSWFEDLFLVQNGGVNALYLSFANWYMCYALLVSTGYLLFLILMWFINYVRKILEGGNSFGHGGF